MDDLLNDIINIIKWTEEGIKCNNLEFREKQIYESFAYNVIKNKVEDTIKKAIEEAKKEEENGKCG